MGGYCFIFFSESVGIKDFNKAKLLGIRRALEVWYAHGWVDWWLRGL